MEVELKEVVPKPEEDVPEPSPSHLTDREVSHQFCPSAERKRLIKALLAGALAFSIVFWLH